MSVNRKQFAELRKSFQLYWLVSDDRSDIQGPFAIQPKVTSGYTVFGITADTLGRKEWQ